MTLFFCHDCNCGWWRDNRNDDGFDLSPARHSRDSSRKRCPIRTVGVGINLQPARCENFYDLGLREPLDEIGVQAKEWALVGRNGNDVWAEPGLDAGYQWPQYSIHRGKLQMLLYQEVVRRLGANSVITGNRLLEISNHTTIPSAPTLLIGRTKPQRFQAASLSAPMVFIAPSGPKCTRTKGLRFGEGL